MRKMRLWAWMFPLCIAAFAVHAQNIVDTTVCDVLKNPAAFDGKMVRIKGTVVAGFDQFVITDGNCGKPVNGVWLAYPEGTNAKSGPVAMVEVKPARNFTGKIEAARPPVKLEKDSDFKQFDSYLSKTHERGGTCMGCAAIASRPRW